MLEKAATDRIWEYLDLEGPNISEDQYGFRAGWSTIEDINRVISLARSAMFGGGVALAVSLDIVNAFNYLPWTKVKNSLVRYRVQVISTENHQRLSGQ